MFYQTSLLPRKQSGTKAGLLRHRYQYAKRPKTFEQRRASCSTNFCRGPTARRPSRVEARWSRSPTENNPVGVGEPWWAATGAIARRAAKGKGTHPDLGAAGLPEGKATKKIKAVIPVREDSATTTSARCRASTKIVDQTIKAHFACASFGR